MSEVKTINVTTFRNGLSEKFEGTGQFVVTHKSVPVAHVQVFGGLSEAQRKQIASFLEFNHKAGKDRIFEMIHEHEQQEAIKREERKKELRLKMAEQQKQADREAKRAELEAKKEAEKES